DSGVDDRTPAPGDSQLQGSGDELRAFTRAHSRAEEAGASGRRDALHDALGDARGAAREVERAAGLRGRIPDCGTQIPRDRRTDRLLCEYAGAAGGPRREAWFSRVAREGEGGGAGGGWAPGHAVG